MLNIELYHRAIKDIEKPFIGMPYPSILLIKFLVTLANAETGVVKNVSYKDLADILKIKAAPGRKNTGIPTKQAIRNYIKSLERECGEHFKVISEGQSLRFLFPDLPQIFNKIFRNAEFNTGLNTDNDLQNSDQNIDTDKKDDREPNIGVNTHNPAVKNINIFNITNSNKQTQTASNDFSRSKKPIGNDFYPNTKTIEMAFSMGLTKVTDKEEIQAFIKHNKKQNTLWADFNPVFINWLERDAQYMQKQLQKAQGQLRSHHNERGTNQSTLNQTALERVSEHHGISIDSLWDTSGNELNSGSFIEGTLVQPLDEADCNIRATFYQ